VASTLTRSKFPPLLYVIFLILPDLPNKFSFANCFNLILIKNMAVFCLWVGKLLVTDKVNDRKKWRDYTALMITMISFSEI